jgi:hypothetical protein
MSDDLRDALEAAHKVYREAISARDAAAFMEAAIPPPHVPPEQFLLRFDEFAEQVLAGGPDLADRQFVAIKKLGEDLAGYYSLWRPADDPQAACVALTAFRRTPEGWREVIGGATVTFTPKPGGDVQAMATEIIESDEDMKLRPTGDREAPRQTESAIEATLSCMAYDCELSIAINGAALGFGGGRSRSQRLQGMPEGAAPEEPRVLRVGENEVVMTYRRKAEGPPATLEITIEDVPRLRMTATRAEGRLSGSFVILPSPPEDMSPAEIACVEITDPEEGPAKFKLMEVAPADPRFAFRMEVPPEWVQPALPPEDADSKADESFRPVAVFMAPYGAVLVTFSVRPAPTVGTVAELLTGLSQQVQVELSEIGPAQAGSIVGVGALATQESQMGQMTLRVVMFEQGGWAHALMAMAPTAIWDSLRPTFEHVFESFALANPLPPTIPPWPSDR